ncbi:MAG: Multicopper oxidase [uncultured Sulfurovum sp.]|uniref:Multicopper oxidase n=1 Tax=uncultured Sulfurovum sp. TaxID=269237 RepID=A0A6S6SG07_9BACT|nr:MAG: Multicopper oxidase [uncultured Sulfurovum sp.]
MFKFIGLSVITAGLLVGCGSSSSTPETNSGLLGSVVKGPITEATVIIYDAIGKEVARTTSKDGKFTLPSIELTSDYYTIETTGGSYEDESSNTTVNVGANEGLKTLLSKAELEMMLTNKEYAALTPETTIFTALTKENLQDNNLSASMTKASELIYKTLIENSSPMSGLAGDYLVRKGDLTQDGASSTEIAFAKNRAISFSNLMESLGISPSRVFEIIGKISTDFKDGTEDGIEVDGQTRKASDDYTIARNEFFQDTTTRLRDGNLSEGEREQLVEMGFDVERLENDRANKDANLSADIAKYLASTTLPTLHILETISDEDGNITDAKETYTLTAKTDVNVTIETPEGSWITPMWRYNDKQLPVIIRTSRGTEMTLKLDNQLASDSTIHWHGFKIPAIMDGGPDVPVAPSTTKDYTFSMLQPAAPLWFHPHPDMETGKQVYMGLAGAFLLEDDISKKLEADKNLPSGDRDVVLLVQDRRFAAEANGVRELQYMTMDMDSDGMLGDKILVNGSVIPKLEVDTAQYRFRLYNVSNARNYDFAFDDNRTFKVVATDGGLLNEPVELTNITLGAAERVEIIVDFSNDAIDSKILMVSRPTAGDMMGMIDMDEMDSNSSSEMSGMSEMDSNSDSGMDGMSGMDGNGMGGMDGMAGSGEGLVIMRFDVKTSVADDVILYQKLPESAEISTRIDPTTAVNATANRQFVMQMTRGANTGGGMNMSFVINSKTFDMNRVDEFITADTTEIWEIRNASPMAHPFHAHAVQYQILERNGVAVTGVDLGWKDTFLVQPGGSVKIIAKFDPVLSVGDYMYHCHILEHEDAGMMGYFRVGTTGNVGSN